MTKATFKYNEIGRSDNGLARPQCPRCGEEIDIDYDEEGDQVTCFTCETLRRDRRESDAGEANEIRFVIDSGRGIR